MILIAFIVLASVSRTTADEPPSTSWVVHVPDASGSLADARALAADLGFIVIAPELFDGYYHVQPAIAGPFSKDPASRARRSAEDHAAVLRGHARIRRVLPQTERVRQRRTALPSAAPTAGPTTSPPSDAAPTRFDRLDDPLFPQQTWYFDQLDATGPSGAWAAGYDGTGVVISMVDDGVVTDHPDLAANFDAGASHNFNARTVGDPHAGGGNTDPYPDTRDPQNSHGTRCAGVAAAVANNSRCGVGVASGARIGGIRILDGNGIYDQTEAAALSWNRNHVDIYSCSWGPNDTLAIYDGPRFLTRKALREGTTFGRDGLGSLFVWAAGNGGDADQCNADGYVTSIHTIAISAVSRNLMRSDYAEQCTSIMASTASEYLSTTDMMDCANASFRGTSAAAPIAAGAVALALQANPCLTWRDVQHLIVGSVTPHGDDRVVNGAGRAYSRSFGFGLLNASRLVAMAKAWSPVASQLIVRTQGPVDDAGNASSTAAPDRNISQAVDVTGCSPGSDGTLCIAVLEHVVVQLAVTVANRGLLDVAITSPTGTVSTLIAPRIADSFAGDFVWDFMTLQHWGEPAAGNWTLAISGGAAVTLRSWKLVAHGTTAITAVRSRELGHTAPAAVLPNGCAICDRGTQFTDEQGNCGACDPGCSTGCSGPGRAGCVVVDDGPDGRTVEVVVDDNTEARRAFIVLVGLVAAVVFVYSLADQVQKRRAFDRLIATHNEINPHQEPLLETDALPGAPRTAGAYEQANTSYEPPSEPEPIYMEIGPAATSSLSSAGPPIGAPGDHTGYAPAAQGDAMLDQYAIDDAHQRHGGNGPAATASTDEAGWFPSLTAAVGAAVGTEPAERQQHPQPRGRLVMNDSTMDASTVSDAGVLAPFFPEDNTEESSI